MEQDYLERVESAAMGVLVDCLINKDFEGVRCCLEVLERLSIV